MMDLNLRIEDMTDNEATEILLNRDLIDFEPWEIFTLLAKEENEWLRVVRLVQEEHGIKSFPTSKQFYECDELETYEAIGDRCGIRLFCKMHSIVHSHKGKEKNVEKINSKKFVAPKIKEEKTPIVLHAPLNKQKQNYSVHIQCIETGYLYESYEEISDTFDVDVELIEKHMKIKTDCSNELTFRMVEVDSAYKVVKVFGKMAESKRIEIVEKKMILDSYREASRVLGVPLSTIQRSLASGKMVKGYTLRKV